jgi:hypothetical protein
MVKETAMKVSIESDGTSDNTRVIDDAGHEIDHTRIEWWFDWRTGVSWARITIPLIPAKVETPDATLYGIAPDGTRYRLEPVDTEWDEA